MIDLNSPSNLAVATDTEWNYDKSVVKMRQLVVKWKNLSLEMLRELYVAKLNLSSQGYRSDIIGDSNGWGQYLNDIGLARTTVDRWLSKYDFDNDELITNETIRLPQEIEGDDVLPTTHNCPDCGYEYDGAPSEIGLKQLQRLNGMEMVEHQRQPDDFYPTHPAITQMLLDREKFDGTIWEPACGKGDMSKVFIDNGYDVLSTDLIDRGYGEGGINFLDDAQVSKFGSVDNIITNPPFRFALDFVLQAKKMARKKICILNATMFLDGIKRYEMWQDKEFALKTMYQFSGRVAFVKNEIADQSIGSGLIPWAWFVYEKGYAGEPTIKWILPEPNAKT